MMKQILSRALCLLSVSLLSGCVGHGLYYTHHRGYYQQAPLYPENDDSSEYYGSQTSAPSAEQNYYSTQTQSTTDAPMRPGVNGNGYTGTATQTSGVIPVGRSIYTPAKQSTTSLGTGYSGSSTSEQSSGDMSNVPDVR